ncbi:hypothetical protein [Streptomyces sp. NPDC005930]|uniref:hypothetical protein n=1 Tax=Streptomyces sp. NPDC005930 TaxID=3364736 RepID=UPI0036B57165
MLPDLPEAPAEAARLTELRPTAVQDRVEADLALGGGPGRRTRLPGGRLPRRAGAPHRRHADPVRRAHRARCARGFPYRGHGRHGTAAGRPGGRAPLLLREYPA